MTDISGPDRMDKWPTGRLLSTAARLVEHAWIEALAHLGLTHAGLVALHLLDAGPHSQTDLARRARVETQTMSRTIERLEREGFVERQTDAADRRRQVVTRTASGRAAWEAGKSLEAEVFPDLRDQGTLRDALLEIIHSTSESRWSG
jgi:DNA-binding MarR family transcriptional regulator